MFFQSAALIRLTNPFKFEINVLNTSASFPISSLDWTNTLCVRSPSLLAVSIEIIKRLMELTIRYDILRDSNNVITTMPIANAKVVSLIYSFSL